MRYLALLPKLIGGTAILLETKTSQPSDPAK